MPQVYPFHALQYRGGSGDVSALVSPPYDVLDASQKSALLEGNADKQYEAIWHYGIDGMPLEPPEGAK